MRRRFTNAVLVLGAFFLAVLAGVLPAHRAGAAVTPTLNISDATPFPVTEGNTGATPTVTFTVSLSSSPASAVTVAYATQFGSATAGSDYVYKESSLTFAAGASGAALSQTFTVTITGDTVSESNENFFVQLYNPVNATLGDRFGEALIADDDAAAGATISVADIAPFLENATTVNFPVTISALPVSGSVTVHAATGYGNATTGSDYTPVNDQTITWTSASSLTQNVPVVIIEDAISEADETFWLQLWNPTGATLSDRWGVATILNDDAAAPTISIADDTSPEGTNVTLNVTLSISPSAPVSVSYATMPGNYFDTDATPGSDFTATSGTLNWASGASGAALTQTINVPIAADGVAEGTEHFWTQIFEPVGGNLAAQRYGKGTISSPPVAAADAQSAVGNTKLVVQTTRPAEPHRFVASGSVLGNDTDPEGDTLTVTGPSTTTQGGTLSLNADGSFVYLPPVGFTGVDTFVYTVSDGQGSGNSPNTATATETITVANRVWYVNNAGAAGDGRSNSPFNTLASVSTAGDPDGTGDYIFLFQGSGNYGGGLVLETDERLIGQPEGLVVGADTLFAPSGTNPVITNAGGGGITLANNNTIRRVNVTGTSGAGISGSAITTADIGPNSTISSSTGAGFSLFGSASGNVLMGANITHSSASGRSVFVAGRTGGTVTISGSVNDTAGGVQMDINTGATVNFTGGLSLSTTGNESFKATNGGTVSVTGTNTLSSTTGPALTVTGTTIGAGGLTFQSINQNGTAPNGIILNGTGSGPVTVTGTGGPPATAGSGGTIQNTTGDGISLTNVGGAVSLNGMATTNVVGTDVLLNGGAANVTFAGTITNQAAKGKSVDVSNKTGGTVLFSGAISDSANGINLATNTGATINFTGGLTMSTGTNPAFTATGGGTVSVTGASNTIITTTGVALNVANTTIGASGLTFQSITAGTAASGPASGIVLNNTGTGAGLTVTGTGTAGSGGTIQKTTGAGISLLSTQSPSFARMSIKDTGFSGVDGSLVTNFSLTNSTIDNSGTALGVDASNVGFNSNPAPIGTRRNLSGVVTITGNTLTNAFYHGVDIFNFDATIDNATISNNTITSSTVVANSKGSGIRLVAFGSGSTVANIIKATLDTNTITNFPSAVGLQVQCGNANSAAASPSTCGTNGSATNIINITNNPIHGQSPAVQTGAEGIIALVNGKGQGNFNIAGNDVRNTKGTSISSSAFGFATVTETITGNTVVSNNTVASQGIGIGTSLTFTAADTPSLTATVSGNNISQTDGNGILAVARDANGTLKLKIQNNTVAAPLSGVRQGIRIDSGNSTGNETVCLNISGNTSAPSVGQPAALGIGLRRQSTNTNVFGVNGMAATATPGVENYVNGLNPAGGGTLLISSTSGFSNCSLP